MRRLVAVWVALALVLVGLAVSPAQAASKKLTSAPTPLVSGNAYVGEMLKAKPGTWKPSGVKLSYQWYRGSLKIKGATKSSYKLTSKDKGKTIKVKVTGKKSKYKSVTKTSNATAKVTDRPPSVSFKSATMKVATPCGKITVKYKQPVLKDSTKKNRDQVNKWAKWVPEEIKKWAAAGDYCVDQVKPEGFAEGTVYEGRYLSIALSWDAAYLGSNLETLNLDLKTGKVVTMSTFTSNVGGVRDGAICKAVGEYFRSRGYGYVSIENCPYGDEYKAPVVGWRIANKGLHVYTPGDDGFFHAPVVPWSYLVKADYKTAKKHVTKNVKILYMDEVQEGSVTVTIQGNLVEAVDSGVDEILYGVKGWGGPTGDGWLVHLFPSKEYGVAYIWLLTLKSEASNKAIHFRYR